MRQVQAPVAEVRPEANDDVEGQSARRRMSNQESSRRLVIYAGDRSER